LLLADGKQPGPYASVEAAKAAGAVTLNYGLFINALLTFFIVAFAAFLIVRLVNRLRRRAEGAAPTAPATKECPYCLTALPVRATRCSACTSQLGAGTMAV
jgi:large conductance mechanosensitive channel